MGSCFITLEGIDGAGKSTALAIVARTLRARGIEFVVTREPGGTAVGERLRDVLLTEPMCAETEALIVFAARQEHLARVIEPALAAGQWVVCDRFTDATIAYQGAGRGLPLGRLEVLEQWVQQGRQPDLTLLFDVPVDVARERRGLARVPDRIEAEKEAFFERVRLGYLDRARTAPSRIEVIDGRGAPEVVASSVEKCILTLCKARQQLSC